MDILILVLGLSGAYITLLVMRFLHLACKALRIWINIQLYGRADDYAGYYERKRDRQE